MERYTEENAKAIDKWVGEGWVWGRPVTPEECEKARRGEWEVVLTPTKPVPKGWFVPFQGARILGLASGGGQQMPIFSLLGASCTVMDLSDRQLESERLVSEREGYDIEIVKADMTKPFPFGDCAFDLIFHPVSNCYVEDVYPIWRECYRVLKPGGILLAGLDNGANYVFDDAGKLPMVVTGASFPYNPLKNPEQMEEALKNDDGIQFSHTFDEQIGGQIDAGFAIVGAYQDYNGVGEGYDYGDGFEFDATVKLGIPTFWATKALKPKSPLV